MSDEYEYEPWVGWNGGECPVEFGTMVQVCYRVFRDKEPAKVAALRHAYEWCWSQNDPSPIIAYRIATPKPKRELVVGKWYRTKWRGEWFQCLFGESEYLGGYFRKHKGDDIAEWRELDQIDWSVPPRDEAPE